MKLIKKIKYDDAYWVIYKLDDDEVKALNTTKKYVVSQNEFSDYWMKKHMDTLKGRVDEFRPFVNGKRRVYYEGAFETELEAYYHIKCADLEDAYDKLRKGIEDLLGKFPVYGRISYFGEYEEPDKDSKIYD